MQSVRAIPKSRPRVILSRQSVVTSEAAHRPAPDEIFMDSLLKRVNFAGSWDVATSPLDEVWGLIQHRWRKRSQKSWKEEGTSEKRRRAKDEQAKLQDKEREQERRTRRTSKQGSKGSSGTSENFQLFNTKN